MSASVTELVAYVPPPSPEVDVYSVCSRIEQWAADATDVFLLKDNKSKLAAIDHYLAQTSKDGRAAIATAMRRLEVRIGEVLGDPKDTQGRALLHRDEEVLSPQERSQFRKMAANPDVVEAVIADSTDENPASRAKVLEAIKEKESPVQPTPSGRDQSRAGVELRVATAKEMAAEGYSSSQIAHRLGISSENMSSFRRRHGIDVPADAFVGKSQARVDSNRIVGATVDDLAHLDAGLHLVNYSDLDGDQLSEWIRSLETASSVLQTLIRNLKKERSTRDQH